MEFLNISGCVQFADHVEERVVVDLISFLHLVPFQGAHGFMDVSYDNRCLGIAAEGQIDERWGQLIESIMDKLTLYLVSEFHIKAERPDGFFELNIRLESRAQCVRLEHDIEDKLSAA